MVSHIRECPLHIFFVYHIHVYVYVTRLLFSLSFGRMAAGCYLNRLYKMGYGILCIRMHKIQHNHDDPHIYAPVPTIHACIVYTQHTMLCIVSAIH